MAKLEFVWGKCQPKFDSEPSNTIDYSTSQIIFCLYFKMQGMTSRKREVNGVPTSLLDLGYTDVGLDDAW
jgi:hypothetical protein